MSLPVLRGCAAASLLALVLSACAPLSPPATPAAFGLPVQDRFQHQASAVEAPVVEAWWQVFADPQLDALINQATRHNTELAAAAARVAAAQAVLAGRHAERWPELRATAGASRLSGPLVNAAGLEGQLVTAGVALNYELDLSGRLSAQRDAATLDASAEAHLLRSAQLAVQAEVAHHYLALRALDAEHQLAQRSLAAWQQAERITQQRLQQGSVPEQALLQSRGDRLQAEAALQALVRRRAELVSSLALLLGEPANAFTLLAQAGWQPHTPAIPPGIPSEVLTRRPDVAAAVAQWQAAQARRSSAQAAVWPSFSLTASGGQASSSLVDLLRASSRAFGLGAFLAAPLLDGGGRDADIAQARAQEDQALAQGRTQVLTALKQVEDQLVGLQTLHAQAAAHQAASDAATRSAALAQSRWHHGLASQLELLAAEQQLLRWQTTQLQTQAAEAQATVGLIRVLVGGWVAGSDAR